MSCALFSFRHAPAIFRRFQSKIVAVAELKVWRVAEDENFPEGMKYSMFLVNKDDGRVLVGFDNHKPKGHHLHIHGSEIAYEYQGIDKLIDGFWNMVQEEGYLL